MAGRQDELKNGSAYSRRHFLINAAKLAGAVVAYPLLSHPEAAAAQSAGRSLLDSSRPGAPLRIGVLLPGSAYYPDLARTYLAAMALYFEQAGLNNVTMVSEDVGAGSRNVAQKVEAMLQKERVDLLVGMVNPSVAASVRPLLEGSQTAFIASNLGENVPRMNEYSPYIFYHTLGLWQANWALGNWAARNLGARAVLASSFYDSGFDAGYAFRAGYESGGGQITASAITHRPDDDRGFAPLMAAIQESRPDVVFAGYQGQLAADFLNAYAGAGLSGSIPLTGTAYLTEQQVLRSVGKAAAGVKTAFSWSTTLATPENQSFLAGYRSKTGQDADALALLGFETAQLIATSVGASRSDGRSLVQALATAQFTGPRGTITMNGQSHSTSGLIYLQEVQQGGFALQNAIVDRLKSGAEQDGQIASLYASEKSGWLHTYLCV